MLNLIQNWITKYNFQLFILVHFIASIITFYIFPYFETFIVISSWITLAIFFYWSFILKVPVILISVLYFFILKIQHSDFSNIKVDFHFIFFTCVCSICVLFWLWTNPPQIFIRCKNYLNTIKKSEENISACLKDYVPFFGSNKEQLLWSFLVINSLCFLNNTLALNLFVSEDQITQRLIYIFTTFSLILFFFNILLEIWIVLYSSYRVDYSLLIFAARFINLVLVIVTAGYIFDRFCLSGDFHPPTKFALCRWYHNYKLGCIVRTKEDLQAVNQYLSLGLKDPFPFTEINGVKELNRSDLDIRINTKIILIESRNKRIKDAVDAAFDNFMANLDPAEASEILSENGSSNSSTHNYESKSKKVD